MARSLKSRGMEEVAELKKRVNRQHQLERIGMANRDYLIEHLNLIEARIVSMNEKQEREGGFIW